MLKFKFLFISFFYQYLINNLKIDNNFVNKLPSIHNNLVLEVNKPIVNFVTNFNYNNLFFLLNVLLKSKK